MEPLTITATALVAALAAAIAMLVALAVAGMADAARTLMRYRRDEIDGTNIDGSDDFLEIPRTSDSLKQTTQHEASQTIRADRNVAQMTRTNVNVEGDIEFELAYGHPDDLWESGLLSEEWSSAHVDVTDDDISMDVAGGVIELRSDTDEAFENVEVGCLVEVSGFATAGNNGLYLVRSIEDFDAGGSETLNALQLEAKTATAPATEATGQTVTIRFGEFITNGTRETTVDFEREYQSLTDTFARYLKCEIEQFGITVDAQQIINGTVSVRGAQELFASSTLATGSTTDAPDNDNFNAVDHLEAILEGGEAEKVSELNFTVNNNFRERYNVGVLGPDSYGKGFSEITGSLTRYFDDKSLHEKYLNDMPSSLFVVLKDSNGNRYAFEMPTIRYTDSGAEAPGVNDDVTSTMEFQATLDTTLRFSLRIHRMAA